MSAAIAQLRTLLLQPWFDPLGDFEHAATLYDASTKEYRRKRVLVELSAEAAAIEARLLDSDCERVRAKWQARPGDDPMPMLDCIERDKLRKRLRYLKAVVGAKARQ